jgi:hypothetical protein
LHLISFVIDGVKNQHFGSRRSRFNGAFKWDGVVPINLKSFQPAPVFILVVIPTTAFSGERKFEVDNITVDVKGWFDVIHSEKTGL